jgi:flagellar hook-associated protein 1
MSLNSALITARSGLDATQVWSEVTSSNIANVNTDGYVRKEVGLTTTSAGQGGLVQVSDIRREVDASLDRMYRLESGKMSKQQAIYEGVQAYTATLGQPSDATSPASRLSALQTAFGTLANAPGSAAAQQGVLDAAKTMASSLNQASATLDEVQGEVTTEIKYDVSDLNKTLYQIADLNKQLVGAQQDSVAGVNLKDQMGKLVQSVSKLMDVQVSTDGNGQVSLYTAGGTPLIEGQNVSDLRYDDSTGKLYAGSAEITPGSTGVRGFENGSLAGLYQLKDSTLPTFRKQLDDFAANLIQGFQSQDASLTAGQAGLFTDAGAAYSAANLDGLAGRIAVNAAVDPAQGGTLGRIRDGVGAATPGAAGDATQVNAFLKVFSQPTTAAAGTDLASGMTLSDYAANMISYQQVAGTRAQAQYQSLQTSAQAISSSRQSIEGVNLDNELQKLIVIQHSYAANSKMMSTIAQMMDALIQAV